MKNGVGIGIAIIFIFLVLFYWFQYRPSEIKKECNNSAFVESMKTTWTEDIKSQAERLDLKNKLYEDCLRYKGI